MGKQFIVITEVGKLKETYPWWERSCSTCIEAKVFDNFDIARNHMRSEITECIAPCKEQVLNLVFDSCSSNDDDEDINAYEEDEEVIDEEEAEDDEFEDLFADESDEDEDDFENMTLGMLSNMLGMPDYWAKDRILKLTTSLVEDPDFYPYEVDERKGTDDADHYFAYVSTSKNVIADNYHHRLEYNIHNMDDENRYYYFELHHRLETEMEVVVSIRLINTEENIDDSASVFEDNVSCKQIEFGTYIQSNDPDAVCEPITWDILEEKDDRILVMSHKCLEYRPFNDGKKSCRWNNSLIRKWLNNDFLNSAFDDKERGRIILSTVETETLKPTKDRIFLLSQEEFSLVGYDNRKATLTSVARAQYSEKIGETYTEPYGFWWLRTPGACVDDGYDLVHVCANGGLNAMARSDSSHPNGIRPAMWIKK